MAKGSPNGPERKLNFMPRVYDEKATDDPTYGKYRPLYIAPEATDEVLGDVYLSDAINSTANAENGVEAATPLAVKTAYDEAKKKLDKTEGGTVSGAVTFTQQVTGSAGFKGNLTGNVTGNADTATTLKTARKITVLGTGTGTNSVTFNGGADVTLTLSQIDASKVNTGTLPISVVPKAALERVVHVTNQAARFQLTTDTVQLGDTVIQDDTGVMYIVVNESKLNTAEGYEEYAAATATNALHADEADVLSTPRTIITNLASTATASFDGSADVTPGVTGTLPLGNGGTGATTANAAEYNIIGMPAASSTAVTDATKMMFAFDVPDSSQGSLYSRNASYFWTYIKGKADPTYAAKSHTHAVFTASVDGFVPHPGTASKTKFLRDDGTWQVAGEVTGVKGNAEMSYRTGNVNLTPANIGAAAASHTHNYLPLTGGTLTGNLSSRQIAPSATNTYTLGTSSLKWSNVYATTFTGNLTGNVTGSLSGNATTATTASKVNQTLTLTGNVTGSVSLNATGTRTMSTTIADKAVTNGKLADDVGTVFIGNTEPTEEHIKLWIKI